MQTPGERMRSRRIELGWTQNELADRVGMKQTGIDSIENTPVRRPRKAMEIAQALGVRLEWLLEGEGPKFAADPTVVAAGEEFSPDPDPDAVLAEADGRRVLSIPPGGVAELDFHGGLGGGGIPVEVRVRDDNGGTYVAEAVRDWWRLPDWLYAVMAVRAEDVRCFRVQGDSMVDTLDDGDVVFVDISHRWPSPPGLYALDDGFGGIIVKRLHVTSRPGEEPITVRIASDNPRYPPEMRTLEEARIVGRYLAVFSTRNRKPV